MSVAQVASTSNAKPVSRPGLKLKTMHMIFGYVADVHIGLDALQQRKSQYDAG